MGCVPKYDAYFDTLEKVGDTVIVPAEKMVLLSNNVHHYQNSRKRNKKGLFLKCENVLNRKEFRDEFTVRVVGVGRWDEEKKEEDQA